MKRGIRPWMIEAFVITFCSIAFGVTLFIVFKSDGVGNSGGIANSPNGATGSSSSLQRTLQGTDTDEPGDDAQDPPVQLHIRSPEAAPDLTNDSAGPLFIETNMAPGTTSTRCVAVTNIGLQMADIRLFATVADKGLGPHVSFMIEAGDGGGYGDCARFAGTLVFRGSLAQFAANHRDFATGIAAPERVYPNESVSFRLTQRLEGSSPQGVTAVARFGWEARGAGAPSPLRGRDAFSHRGKEALHPAKQEAGRNLPQIVLKVSAEVAKRGWSWIVLLGLVIVFLVIQDRIDRRDPRLAGARVYPEPELPFGDELGGSNPRSETNV